MKRFNRDGFLVEVPGPFTTAMRETFSGRKGVGRAAALATIVTAGLHIVGFGQPGLLLSEIPDGTGQCKPFTQLNATTGHYEAQAPNRMRSDSLRSFAAGLVRVASADINYISGERPATGDEIRKKCRVHFDRIDPQ